MSSVNIKLGQSNTRASTGELMQMARTLKSLMLSGDPEGSALFMDMFGPAGSGGMEALDEVRHMKGWNWTSCLANALQFVQSDIAVFARADIAEMINQYDPTLTRSADQQTLQSQDIPHNYVPAPDLHAIKRLLQRPNPWTSIEFFKFDMAMQWEAHGVCHILVLPDGNGYPKQLYVIPRAFIAPSMATRTFEGGFRVGRLNRWFTPQYREIKSAEFDPQSLHEAYALLSDRDYPSRFILQIGLPGLLWKDEFASPNKAIAETLITDRLIRASRAATMQAQIARGPSLREKDGVTLSPDEREFKLAEFQARNHGIANEGRARWKDDQVEVDEQMFDAREMEYTVGAEQSRDDILGQKMTPPAIVGVGDTAGFAGVIGLAKTWALFRGQPMMDLYGGQLTSGLRSFYESPKDEFLVKITAGRIDDEAQEEQKLMNDVSATAITVGEFRAARKRPLFGDERDKAIAGTLGPGIANLLDGAAAASYGGDGEDMLSGVPTPGLGAAVQEDPTAPAKSELAGLSLLQRSRDRKSIMEYLREYAEGRMTRELASEFLQMLGLSEERATRMLDKVKQGQQTAADAADEVEAADDSEEVIVIESASVTKAFGQPIDSGLPYIIIPMPEAVQQAVDQWRSLLLGVESEANRPPQPQDAAHVTVFGPIMGDRAAVLELAQPSCELAMPFDIRIGKVKILRNETGNVVTLEVLGPDLYELNRDLQNRIPSPIAWHGFNAHLTVCYVGKGEFQELDGQDLGGLTGLVVDVRRITFGTRGGPVTEFKPMGAELVRNAPTSQAEPGPATTAPATVPESITKAATALPAAPATDSTSAGSGSATEPRERAPAKNPDRRKSLGMSTTSGEAGAFAQASARFGVKLDEDEEDEESNAWQSMMKLWE